MEILIIFFLFILNGLFAMYEIGLVSARKSRLQELARGGNKGAKAALKLLKEPEKILSAIQVGITLVGIIAGAYGGAAFTDDLEPVIAKISWLKDWSATIAMIVVVGLITYFSLIIGELVPKTIALNYSEKISCSLSPFMRILGKTTYPIVWFLSISTKGLMMLFRIKATDNPPITEEELHILLKQSGEYGVIEKEESVIIKEVIRIGDRTARDIMTPRTEVEVIMAGAEQTQIHQKLLHASHSRIPFCSERGDIVTGIIVVRLALAEYASSEAPDPEKFCLPPLNIPESTPVFDIIRKFREKKTHIGVVVDEYGAFSGIITLHDLIENIIGDIPDMDQTEISKVVTREDGSLLVDGFMNLHDLYEALDVKNLYEQNETNEGEVSVAGFALRKFGYIPSAGDHFVASGFIFEVMDMDENRIDKLLIRKN